MYSFNNKFNLLYGFYLNEAAEDKLASFINNVFLKKYNLSYGELNDKQKQELQDYILQEKSRYKVMIDEISKNDTYKSWLIKMIVSKKIVLPEDKEKIIDLMKKFDQVKLRSDIDKNKKDIQKYNSVSELYDFVKSVKKAKVSDKTIDYGNNEIVFNYENKYDIVKIDNFKDGRMLLKDSNWCVQHEDHFEAYGAPYYMIVLNENNNLFKRIALIHFESKQFKDINDEPVSKKTPRYNDLIKICLELFKIENNDSVIVGGDFGVVFYFNMNKEERSKLFLDELIYDYDISSDMKAHLFNKDYDIILKDKNNIGKIISKIVKNEHGEDPAIEFVKSEIATHFNYFTFEEADYTFAGYLEDIDDEYNKVESNNKLITLIKNIFKFFDSNKITEEIRVFLTSGTKNCYKALKHFNFMTYMVRNNHIIEHEKFDYDNFDFLSPVSFERQNILYFITDESELKEYLVDYYETKIEHKLEEEILENFDYIKQLMNEDNKN